MSPIICNSISIDVWLKFEKMQNVGVCWCLILVISPLQPSVVYLHPLKISENLKIFRCFQGVYINNTRCKNENFYNFRKTLCYGEHFLIYSKLNKILWTVSIFFLIWHIEKSYRYIEKLLQIKILDFWLLHVFMVSLFLIFRKMVI